MYKQDFVAVSLWRSLFDLEFVEDKISIFSSSVDYLSNDRYVDESFPGQKEPKTIRLSFVKSHCNTIFNLQNEISF